jgi:formylglycine-generating enzyme required for sulfatase activity
MRQAVGVALTRGFSAAALVAAAFYVLNAGSAPVAGQTARASGLPAGALPELVEVPAGPFIMGADPSRDRRAFANERWSAAAGEGTVDLPAYYISRHEITVAQFTAFARDTGAVLDQRALAGPPAHPVAFVSWPNALAYCRWLGKKLSDAVDGPAWLRDLARAGWRVSLPDEAQWEKAARGGDRRAYPWGDQPRRDRANYEGSGTTPAGSFACPECPYGLLDMSGNVWEWTRSPNQPYPFDPGDDLANLDGDALFVMRGGHYGDDARQVRTTTRGAADPGAYRAFIGFRVVLLPPDSAR